MSTDYCFTFTFYCVCFGVGFKVRAFKYSTQAPLLVTLTLVHTFLPGHSLGRSLRLRRRKLFGSPLFTCALQAGPRVTDCDLGGCQESQSAGHAFMGSLLCLHGPLLSLPLSPPRVSSSPPFRLGPDPTGQSSPPPPHHTGTLPWHAHRLGTLEL